MGKSRTAEELRHRPLVQRTRASEMTPDRKNIPELKNLEFDLLFLTDTWCDHIKEILEFCDGTNMSLSGDSPHHRVGIVVSHRCWGSMQDIWSHCIANGLWRPNFLFGKMLGSSLFHILWTSRSSFSPCPYGIVVVVFHFDSGGRKSKKKKIPTYLFTDISNWLTKILSHVLATCQHPGTQTRRSWKCTNFWIDFASACLRQKVAIARWGLECIQWTNVPATWLGFMRYMRIGQKEQQRLFVDAMSVGTWLTSEYSTGWNRSNLFLVVGHARGLVTDRLFSLIFDWRHGFSNSNYLEWLRPLYRFGSYRCTLHFSFSGGMPSRRLWSQEGIETLGTELG